MLSPGTNGPSIPEERCIQADVLVIGLGPAGMAAASRAAACGARVVAVDDNSAPGGQIWRGGADAHSGRQSQRSFEDLRSQFITLVPGCQVISASASSCSVLVETPDSGIEIHFQAVVLATGARELFLPFSGWTLPGVMGAGGLQALAKSGLPVAGKSVIVAGSGPLLLAVASNLKKAGARVKLIAEQATRSALASFAFGLLRYPSKLSQAAALHATLLRTPYHFDCWVEAAEGDGRLKQVRLRRGNKGWVEPCDYAAIGYGLYPNIELASLLGCKLHASGIGVDSLQRTSIDHVYAAGECTGIGGVDLSLIEGEIAGYSAAGRPDLARPLLRQRSKAARFASDFNRAFSLRPELRAIAQPATLVCRCEDVSRAKLEHFSSFRAAKLHTRCGMGPCQGRVCGPATEFLFGWQRDTVRPPVFPVRLDILAATQPISEEASQNA